MGIVQRVLERFGYARLRDYGLILTSERRVLTTRTSILDDGYGERVVGWTADDLATAELATWGTEKPAPPKPLPLPPRPIARVSGPPPVVVVPDPTPVARDAVLVSKQALAAQPAVLQEAAPVAKPAPVVKAAAKPARVVDEPVEEDEWEWEIAMARARAAAEEAIAEAEELLGDDTEIKVSPLLPDGSRPKTIIPVPTLPVASDPRMVRNYDTEPARYPRASNQRPAATPPSSRYGR